MKPGNKDKVKKEFDELLLAIRDFIFGIDCFGRTFRLAQGTIYAFIWVYNEKIRPFVKTINRAYVHAISEFASDAIFSHYESHLIIS